MTFEGTYGDLFAYSNELNNFALQQPAVSKLLGGGFEKFESRNKMALQYMRDRLAAMYEENVSKNAEGHFETTGEDFKYKSSAHEKEFKDEWARLMQLECKVIIGQ